MRLLERQPVRTAILLVLVLLALLSAGQGMHNAALRSQDMQWSGVRMLMQHIDPWADALAHDPAHMILKSQIPNYLPLLYILIYPLGLLPLWVAQIVWGICNLAFAIISAWLASRFYGGDLRLALGIVCLTLMSTPARVTVGNGQYGLLVLVLWSLSLLTSRIDDKRAMLSGISYVKFNFAPALFLFLLIKAGWRRALVSLVPVIVGAVLICIWLNEWHSAGQIGRFLMGPMHVVETGGYFPRWGGTNLMDMVEPLLFSAHVPDPILTAISTLIAVITWGVLMYMCWRRDANANGWHMAILGLASFGLFRHHTYDAVTLLFPLCFALQHWRDRKGKTLFAIIAYFWYLQQLLSGQYSWAALRSRLEFLLLVAAMVITYRMGLHTGQSVKTSLIPEPALR